MILLYQGVFRWKTFFVMIIFHIIGMITKSTKPQKIELVKQLEKEPLPNDYNYERQL